MTENLEEVLEDERRQAKILRDNGHDSTAKTILRVCDRVERAAEEYLRFVNESNAMLMTGRSAEWLRARFADLEKRGLAKKHAGVRFYRELLSWLASLAKRDRPG